MTDILYLAPIPDNHPLAEQPASKFSQAALIHDCAALKVSDHPSIPVISYRADDIKVVNHRDFDTVRIKCGDKNGLAQRLASEIKSRPVLLYFTTERQSDNPHGYCGIFRLSILKYLYRHPTSDWQIILNEAVNQTEAATHCPDQ